MPGDNVQALLGERVDYIAQNFWEKNKSTLRCHGQDWKDVRQQSWVEVLVLREEWPTNPTKYLFARLFDWMRRKTGYHRKTKTGPIFYSLDCLREDDVGESSRHEPRIAPEDFDLLDLKRRVVEIAVNVAPRNGEIISSLLEGETMLELGRKHHISEVRVSQIWRNTIKKAVRAFACVGFIAAVLFIPDYAQAQVDSSIKSITSCETINWQANEEPDLAGYHILVAKDGVAFPTIAVGKDKVSFSCAKANIVPGAQYRVVMTAYDESGNVSLESQPLEFDYPDTTSPAVPRSICLSVTIDGVPQSLCLTIESPL